MPFLKVKRWHYCCVIRVNFSFLDTWPIFKWRIKCHVRWLMNGLCWKNGGHLLYDFW